MGDSAEPAAVFANVDALFVGFDESLQRRQLPGIQSGAL
jgi:hypothetical protein